MNFDINTFKLGGGSSDLSHLKTPWGSIKAVKSMPCMEEPPRKRRKTQKSSQSHAYTPCSWTRDTTNVTSCTRKQKRISITPRVNHVDSTLSDIFAAPRMQPIKPVDAPSPLTMFGMLQPHQSADEVEGPLSSLTLHSSSTRQDTLESKSKSRAVSCTLLDIMRGMDCLEL